MARWLPAAHNYHLVRTFDPDGNGTGTIDNSDVAPHRAEQDDAGLGNAPAHVLGRSVNQTLYVNCAWVSPDIRVKPTR